VPAACLVPLRPKCVRCHGAIDRSPGDKFALAVGPSTIDGHGVFAAEPIPARRKMRRWLLARSRASFTVGGSPRISPICATSKLIPTHGRPSTWAPSPGAADALQARRLAVELYSSGVTLSEIKSRTGVERRHFYRLLERCLAPHEHGRTFGWRGLVPHARVVDYERVPDIAPGSGGCRPGAAGAFAQLL
jgi:hypothetical protein